MPAEVLLPRRRVLWIDWPSRTKADLHDFYVACREDAAGWGRVERVDGHHPGGKLLGCVERSRADSKPLWPKAFIWSRLLFEDEIASWPLRLDFSGLSAIQRRRFPNGNWCRLPFVDRGTRASLTRAVKRREKLYRKVSEKTAPTR